MIQADQLDSTIEKLKKFYNLFNGVKKLSDELSANKDVLAQLNLHNIMQALKQV